MENTMETTMSNMGVCWDDMGIMEKRMETALVYWGCKGNIGVI